MKFRFVRNAVSEIKHFKTKVIIAAVIIIALCAGSAVAASEIVVTDVYCDNKVERVISLSDDPYEIISRTSFTVGEDQRVVLDFFDASLSESIIMIANPHEALVYDGDTLVGVVTVAGTVADALEMAGVTLNEGDEVNIPESIGITESVMIKVSRAFNVTVVADGEKHKIGFTGGTVAQALEKAGVVLGEDDIVSAALDKVISKKCVITVQRVTYEKVKKTLVVEHDVKVEYDDSMYEDKSKVKVKGVDGKVVKTYEKKYIDGELESSELISTKVKKEAVTEVIVRGTKVRSGGFTGSRVKGSTISSMTAPFEIPLNSKGRPVDYLKVITGKATAYCTGTTCSTGVRARTGYVAVDPREIPYGTKMYIVSSDGKYNYGYCIAADTGGFIYNSNTVVDLYMNTYNECINFGRRNVDIYILEWGNGYGTKK